MLYGYHDVIPDHDALAHAVSLDDLETNDHDADDMLAGLGFNASTGCDAAMRNPNMLAVGLAMQEEWNA